MEAINPKMTIVIVNWNGKKFLKPCLDSIFKQFVDGIEIVIVDNGSTDGSIDFINNNYGKNFIIENKENLGFAEANNIGIEHSRGEYILTLNNDTVIENDFFINLFEAVAQSEESVGMWAPKILSISDNETIDSVGGLLVSRCGIAKGRGRNKIDEGQFDDVQSFIPSACCALYKREMLNNIGLFDKDFFAYCEDTDLGLRAIRAGYKCENVPLAKVYHHYSGTTGKYSFKKAYLIERNHIWVVLKNYTLKHILLLPFYNFYRYVMQAFGILAGKGSSSKATEGTPIYKLVFAVVYAYFSAFIKFPKMIKNRINNNKFYNYKKESGISIKDISLMD